MTSASGKHLNDALAQALNKRASQSTIRSLTLQPPNAVDFSSNDFLSLATSQDLRRLYLAELSRGPSTTRLGSGGSRLLDGNSTYAEQLEVDIATFHRAENGLLCNSGFDANVGLFSCLPQPGDAIVFDEFIHASVHDGMRLSRAGQKVAFAHNSVSALHAVLSTLIDTDEAIRAGRRNVFIAVEAVYSMDGDVAPLKAIVQILRELLPHGNGHLVVDEAHSNGVLGPQGRGLVCELGLEDQVSVRLHTFGKALACNGAILLCSPLIRQYLINYARPLIYTTFLSYPSLAAIRASYTYLQTDKTQKLTRTLQTLTHHLHTHLQTLITTLALTPTHTAPLLSPPPNTPAIAHLQPPHAAPQTARSALPARRLRRARNRAADGARGRRAGADLFACWEYARGS
ncbi:hypothetical protein Q7P37_008372 [Cladosporium fusiforme]